MTSLQTYAIYDEDNRVDYYKLKDEKVKELSRSVAFQIYFDELRGWTFNRYWELLVRPLSARNICHNERFAEQPVMRNDCTGVLIGPKHLLMPGHCITDHYCKNDLFYYMFDYRRDDMETFNVKRDRNNFYKCKKLLKRVYNPQTAISYAVLELDKTVKDRTPVKIAKEQMISTNEELLAIGHPAGMPLKVAKDAYVTDQNKTHFLVSSDISGSSKGTAIFNARTYELEGMLISGTKEYVTNDDPCLRAPSYQAHEAQEIALKVNKLDLFTN